MYFDWPYYRMDRDGWLVESDGQRCPQQAAPLSPDSTPAEAEEWLVQNDIRGTIR